LIIYGDADLVVSIKAAAQAATNLVKNVTLKIYSDLHLTILPPHIRTTQVRQHSAVSAGDDVVGGV